MTDRAFRFGVVGAPQGGGERWRATARRVEELGYGTLLMPDGPQLLSPWSSLAVAASVTTSLRVGTFVLAAPLRQPRLAAWDAHSLSELLDGRFEFGIGTGRPEVTRQAVENFGMDPSTGAQRLAQVGATIDQLRELDGERHTPVMVAAGGPKARALAAAKADIAIIAQGPLMTREAMVGMVGELRTSAGDRAEDIELLMNIFVIGDEAPPWMQQFLGTDTATLIAHDSLSMLRGTPRQMADELLRRRESLGVSYIAVNAQFFEEMAPVVELLAGS